MVYAYQRPFSRGQPVVYVFPVLLVFSFAMETNFLFVTCFCDSSITHQETRNEHANRGIISAQHKTRLDRNKVGSQREVRLEWKMTPVEDMHVETRQLQKPASAEILPKENQEKVNKWLHKQCKLLSPNVVSHTFLFLISWTWVRHLPHNFQS